MSLLVTARVSMICLKYDNLTKKSPLCQCVHLAFNAPHRESADIFYHRSSGEHATVNHGLDLNMKRDIMLLLS